MLPSLLPELQALIAADTALAYAFEIVDGELVAPEFVEVHGQAAEQVREAFRAQFPAKRKSTTFLYDPISPQPAQRNVALRLRDIPDLANRECTFAGSIKQMGASDQLRVLVCDGPSLLAWVGGLRAEEFTLHHRSLLGRLAEPLRVRLALERRLRDERKTAPIAALLQAIAAPAFLVDDQGRIAHANAVGSELLAGGRSTIRTEAVQASSGGAPGWTPAITVTATGLPTYRLVIRELPCAPRFDAAARDWGLTARQTDVLHHLADGHANKTIAAMLDCATHTVELHVTEILRRAKAESRAALVAKMWKLYGS